MMAMATSYTESRRPSFANELFLALAAALLFLALLFLASITRRPRGPGGAFDTFDLVTLLLQII
jgi:hypothetical protein